jgi:hypothetical protein
MFLTVINHNDEWASLFKQIPPGLREGWVQKFLSKDFMVLEIYIKINNPSFGRADSGIS